ncbi:MAG: hypothetical protein IKB87_02745 [Clostridia bacterium]|nr:hypothetical protein [Clostridia bacterium]
MRTKTKLLALVLAVLMLCTSIASLASCGPTGDDEKSYTFNDFLGGSPLNWNPHTRETNADNYIASYAEMGLVDVSIAEDGVNYQWVFEMATAIDDITSDFADKEKWGITEDEGRVYKITLNPDAKWANGDVINADTYMYSIKALLDPKMQNYRANTYYSGSTAILNANKYFTSETPIYAAVVPVYGENDTPDYSYDIENNTVYMHLTSYDMTLTDSYSVFDLMNMGYIDTAAYGILADNRNSFGYVEINDTTKEAAKTVATNFLSAFGLAYEENHFKEMLFYNTATFFEPYDFENVGIFKSGEYELTYITAQQVQMFYFLTNMTSNWIVHEGLYEAGKDTTGDLVTTNYGTSVGTYMSYGPYKLSAFETDKQFVLERNPAWYGYTDGKHEGQYMTTAIKCDIIPDHEAALRLFSQGKLDGVDLTGDDINTYRMSDYLLKTDQPYTFRYVFATDINKLAALEPSADVNKKVLSYDDFRKAISLSIDRTMFAQQATPAYKPAYCLFNRLYYYDVANNPKSIYRNTDAAKKAILDLYGIEYGEGKQYADIAAAYNAVTGYDLEEAKELFQAVYVQAKADGNYTDGQKVVINCMASAATELTADDLKQEGLLNEFLTAATVGTGFEGKVSVVFNCSAANRYLDVAQGKIEMIRSAWGGAAFYPISAIRCYTEPDYMDGLERIHESCGWDPSKETLELTLDVNGDGTAETVTHTLQDWAKLINGGIHDPEGNTVEAAILDVDARLTIFAALENTVLGSYQCIPFATETTVALYSQQIRYATLNYNIMYGFGGIRLMTYNYDDTTWEAYVIEQGGTLRYE